jgi:putative transcriptional regulator
LKGVREMMEEERKSRVARWIAGDITLSSNPAVAIKRWRETFGVSQTALAKALKISPSVISDYEAGRRKSPGIATIRRIVEAFLKADEEGGGRISRVFEQMFGLPLPPDIVLDIQEFKEPIDGKKLCEAVKGEVAANEDLLDHKLFGYTIIDSLKAVLTLSVEDFKRLYGLTAERALVFTNVSMGRSPMVAIKVIGITPGAVVFHGPIKKVDKIGIKIAEVLRVPLIVSRLASVEELVAELKKCVSSSFVD